MEFLNWFIEEQLEEETNAEDNIRKAEIAGDKGLYMLNREFGKREED
jgi:ferritin